VAGGAPAGLDGYCGGVGFAPYAFRYFSQRALAAFRASRRRSAGVRFFRLALPPFRPSATAYGCLRLSIFRFYTRLCSAVNLFILDASTALCIELIRSELERGECCEGDSKAK
jgi:hypothetical protein